MPTSNDTLRIPVIVRGPDREMLLNLRAKLESEIKRPITITEVFRIAMRELAATKQVG